MWLSPKIFSILEVAKESVDALREELAAVKTERDTLRNDLISTKVTNDFLRLQFNQLQLENKALLERAYNIRVPVPEIVRRTEPGLFNLQDLFSDVGDDQAKEMGLDN